MDREAPANKKNMYQMQKHEHIGNIRVLVAVISAIAPQLFAVLACVLDLGTQLFAVLT